MPELLHCIVRKRIKRAMPPVEIAAPPPSPAPEIVAAQLNKAPLCLPPTSCPGWIAPCLHSLTVAEALRLERTSRRWRAWLLSADHIWQQLAASSGVSLRCAGPLASFFRVASWRRVCVELVGALSRDLRGEDAFLQDAAPGSIVEVFETVSPDRDYTVPAAGEVFGGYVDAPWKAGAKYFGGQGCFLVTLAPAFHVYRATATATNYAYFNPPKTGQLQSSRYGAEQLPETFGFGGAPARQRLGFDDDLNQLVWHSADTSFAAHPAGPPLLACNVFTSTSGRPSRGTCDRRRLFSAWALLVAPSAHRSTPARH
mgnify:CR=1 FL=1